MVLDTTDPPATAQRLLNTASSMDRLGGVTRNTFYKIIRDNPNFPAPRILQGKRYWLESELDTFIDELPRGEAVPEFAERL